MVWPVDDVMLGPRSWGKRPSTNGIIFHTTEYADASRASAVQCARDQARRTADGGWAQPGSYNFIIYDGGLLLCVPYREGSGGVNPNSDFWDPDAWLKEMLPGRAFRDPTMHHLQIAFSGKAKRLAAGSYSANMLRTAARLVAWAERAGWGRDDLILSGHMHWQSNRSDPGAGVIDRILELYEERQRAAARRRAAAAAAAEPTATGAPADTGASAELAAASVPDYEALYRAERRRVRRLRARLRDAEARLTAAREALEGP